MKVLIKKEIINFCEKYTTYANSFLDERRNFFESRLEKVNFESIEYLSNNKKITWYIVSPKNINNECAVLIYNKWWNNNQSFGRLQGDISPKELFVTMWYYAQHGYIVIASNYSGWIGSDWVDEFGGEDIDDVTNLYHVIKELDQADSSKIWMLWYSRGGMMTYLCMTKQLSWLKSCATVWWITDLIWWIQLRPEMYTNVYVPCFGGSQKDMKLRSAIYFIDKISKDTPLLLIQWNVDNKVSPQLALKFLWKAIGHWLIIRAQFYEWGDHYLTTHIKESSETIKDWFNNHLQYLYIYM